jgi:hypothetical protein
MSPAHALLLEISRFLASTEPHWRSLPPEAVADHLALRSRDFRRRIEAIVGPSSKVAARNTGEPSGNSADLSEATEYTPNYSENGVQ